MILDFILRGVDNLDYFKVADASQLGGEWYAVFVGGLYELEVLRDELRHMLGRTMVYESFPRRLSVSGPETWAHSYWLTDSEAMLIKLKYA